MDKKLPSVSPIWTLQSLGFSSFKANQTKWTGISHNFSTINNDLKIWKYKNRYTFAYRDGYILFSFFFFSFFFLDLNKIVDNEGEETFSHIVAIKFYTFGFRIYKNNLQSKINAHLYCDHSFKSNNYKAWLKAERHSDPKFSS